MKIVIVDDSAQIQSSLGRLLSAIDGVRVVGCAEGVADARALIDAQQPDLVVLDVDLRDGDRGYDVLCWSRRTHPHASVAVLSNFTWSAMRDGFLLAGADAYFDKAFEFGRLCEWIAARAAADLACTP